MAHIQRFAATASLIAALSMAATPAAAADIPAIASDHPVAAVPNGTPAYNVFRAFDANSENVQRHRYYRYRHHRHRHGIDGGDVVAGILILGGIAAIASAASKSERDRRYRDREYRNRDYRDRDYDYRDRRRDSRYDGARGIDRAVERCLSQIERDVRVDSVDSVDRRGDGWRVTGQLYNGEGFTCRIGPDGRVDDIDYGSVAAVEDRQHSDDRYRTAWAEVERIEAADASAATPAAEEPLPAYPGGPLPGEDLDDGRYTAPQ